MIRRPPRSTLFPTRRSSDLLSRKARGGGRERPGRRACQRAHSAALAEAGQHRLHGGQLRSEEHTSELQSHLNLVCRLLLEKKKKPKPGYTLMRNAPTDLHSR